MQKEQNYIDQINSKKSLCWYSSAKKINDNIAVFKHLNVQLE